jgi:hypothetical protein
MYVILLLNYQTIKTRNGRQLLCLPFRELRKLQTNLNFIEKDVANMNSRVGSNIPANCSIAGRALVGTILRNFLRTSKNSGEEGAGKLEQDSAGYSAEETPQKSCAMEQNQAGNRFVQEANT